MRKLTIEKVENGYILSWCSEVEDGIFEESKKVIFATEYTEGEEREGIKKLLIEVAEFFGEQYDKWSSENLDITFNRKGHKAE